MIFIRYDSVFHGPGDILINPVNCDGVIDDSVTEDFKDRYPGCHRRYLELSSNGELGIGKLLIYENKGVGLDGKTIICLPVKRRSNEPYDFDDVEYGLYRLSELLRKRYSRQSFSIPLVPCKNIKSAYLEYLNLNDTFTYIHSSDTNVD